MRLIDADALLKALVRKEPFSDCARVVIAECMEEVKHAPTIEPEILRCKDCMHSVDYYHDGDCYCSNPKWGLMYFGGSWEFYCADAERRTG